MHTPRTWQPRAPPGRPPRAHAPARAPRKQSARLALALAAGGALLVALGAASLVAANQAELAGAHYAEQPQQQQPQLQPKSSKKIQIVYIKVPLAKLKQAPGAPADYAANDTSSGYAAPHKPSESTWPDGASTAPKPHGSQPADRSPPPPPPPQQQQLLGSTSGAAPDESQLQAIQLSREPGAQSDGSSFLIPMAYVQETGWQAGSSAPGPRQQLSHGINHGFMSAFLSAEKDKMAAAAARALASMAGGQQQQQQQQQPPVAESAPVAQQVAAGLPPQFGAPQQPLPPPDSGLMPLVMLPYAAGPQLPDSALGQAYGAAVGQALPPLESGLLGSSSSAAATHAQAHASPAAGAPAPEAHQARARHTGPQTGSAASSQYNTGGNSGTSGPAASSPGTSPSGSYGAAGPGQQGSGSSGPASQPSGPGYAGTAPTSGYGSGTSTFGASAAFTDYPAAQSSGSATAGYGSAQQGPQQQAQQQQQQQPQQGAGNSYGNNNNNNNNNYNADQGPDGAYAAQRLRQAKKTIIPIVVQVEHAILEHNGNQNNQNNQNTQNNQNNQNNNNGYPRPPQQANRYVGARGYRQQQQQQQQQPNYNNQNQNLNMNNQNNHNNNQNRKQRGGRYQNNQNQNAPYGAASANQDQLLDLNAPGAQYINAANAHDINQITAQINAENAASAAQALAQADAAFGPGAPAYVGPTSGRQPSQPNHGHQGRPGGAAMAQYANGLQSAASALLANSHPVIQAAASGGLASVSKLGAKLGEFIALPSMQVPGIQALGASLPGAFSSLTNQVGAQLNQAVQQVAKEHPNAHAFARQVAQQAGISLPQLQANAGAGAHPPPAGPMMQHQHQHQHQPQNQPQAQLQNLKLSIGQNLQTAAATLMGVGAKSNAQSAASLLASPLAALYPPSVNAALKQLSNMQHQQQNQQHQQHPEQQHALASSLVPVQEQLSAAAQQLFGQQLSLAGLPVKAGAQQGPQLDQGSPMAAQAAQSGPPGVQAALEAAKPGKPTLKSKFLSFFQPPKFISNLLTWNDRADERNDSEPAGSGAASAVVSGPAAPQLSATLNATATATAVAAPEATSGQAPNATAAVNPEAAKTAALAPNATAAAAPATSGAAPNSTAAVNASNSTAKASS